MKNNQVTPENFIKNLIAALNSKDIDAALIDLNKKCKASKSKSKKRK